MAQLNEPWLGFLTELDAKLEEPVSMACMGGFVMQFCFGLKRITFDIDSCAIHPLDHDAVVDILAGQNSPLRKKYGIYIQHVRVVNLPCDHTSRLLQLDLPYLKRLSLWALDAHDLALSKLERFSERDLFDVQHLAANGHIDLETLQQRYFAEQRSYLLGDLNVYDRRLAIWLESCWPDQFPDQP